MVTIIEAPDDETMAKLALAIGSQGGIRCLVCPRPTAKAESHSQQSRVAFVISGTSRDKSRIGMRGLQTFTNYHPFSTKSPVYPLLYPIRETNITFLYDLIESIETNIKLEGQSDGE